MVSESRFGWLLDNDDWGEVFGDRPNGCLRQTIRTVPGCQPVSCDPVKRSDVVDVIASVDGENDGADWLGVFVLNDGRYLVASGGCCYTGWDCQGGNSTTVFATLEEAIQMGLTKEERDRLGRSLPTEVV